MIVLHHDHPSAASLHAVLLLDEFVAAGVDVLHHGIDVLGVASALPATLDDLQDWERHRDALADLGWDIARPRSHPPTILAHMIERLCPDAVTARAWRLACYDLHWRRGGDLGDPATLTGLAAQVGLDTVAVETHIGDRVALAQTRREMIVARGDGVGGVPVLDVDGTKVSPFMAATDLAALVQL